MNEEIKNSFKITCLNYYGNSNSLHKLGLDSKRLEESAIKQIKDVLKTDKEVIFTSSKNESSSLVLFGYLDKYKYKNKEVIAFDNIDESIIKCLDYIKKFGIKVTIIKDIIQLKDKLNNDVVLVCIKDNIDEIDDILKGYNAKLLIEYNNSNINFNIGDFIIFNIDNNLLKGISLLLKEKNIVIEPLYHGGKSTTIYRSGTPPLPFIVALSKYIKLMYKK